MFNFEYLYNIFNNMLDLGQTLWGWLNTTIQLSDNKSIPLWTIIVASGLTIGLGVRLIRSFVGN